MKRCLFLIYAVLIVLLFSAFASVGYAAEFSLHAGVKTIGAEAFMNVPMPETITIPAGVESIGDRAFYGCDALRKAVIPYSVAFIGVDAFPYSTIIVASESSPAGKWAFDNGYQLEDPNFVPRYYALFVGQTYPNSSKPLPSCANDVQAFANMLQNKNRTPYQVKICSNLKASEFPAQISAAFSDARSGDICLFYYSGHGTSAGSLQGIDGASFSIQSLKSSLDQVNGIKVVILDSCYSGMAIKSGSVAGSVPSLSTIDNRIISVFSHSNTVSGTQPGDMAVPEYHVITASRYDEKSQCTSKYGAFTYYLLKGSGYNESSMTVMSTMPADTNTDKAISQQEAYKYAYDYALDFTQSYGPEFIQHAQCWPANSKFVLWAKR